MIKADYYYKENLGEIFGFGLRDENPRPKYKDGTPANSIYITQVFEKYNLVNGEFPITTLRNTAIKTGIQEILWIYQDQTNSLEKAKERGINWWKEWDIGNGTIGQRYGATIGKYAMVDNLLTSLKENPFDRGHIMNLWQLDDLNSTKGLRPCAYETIWSCNRIDGKMYLDLTLVQRSNDYIMAGYINKIQYVALQMMIAGHLGYEIGTFCHLIQNLHVYERHTNALTELLLKKPLDVQPILTLKEKKNFYDYTVDDFEISGIENITKLKSQLEIAI